MTPHTPHPHTHTHAAHAHLGDPLCGLAACMLETRSASFIMICATRPDMTIVNTSFRPQSCRSSSLPPGSRCVRRALRLCASQRALRRLKPLDSYSYDALGVAHAFCLKTFPKPRGVENVHWVQGPQNDCKLAAFCDGEMRLDCAALCHRANFVSRNIGNKSQFVLRAETQVGH